MILVFDTETTGTAPGRICQLSYIMAERTEIVGKNFFFAVDYIEPGAAAVNGLTVPMLKDLSGGAVFADRFMEIKADFDGATLMAAHNFLFDHMFMSAEYKRLGSVFCYPSEFDTMKRYTPICKLPRSSGGYKFPKLSELIQFLDLTEQDVLETALGLFDTCNGFHDARFDTAATYLAMNAIRRYDAFHGSVIENNL